LYGWYEKRIGRYWPVKPEAMVLDAEKICTSCFRVWKTEAAKSIWRLTGWPLWLVNGNGRCWPVGTGRNVLAVGKHWALGCWPAKPETKMPPAGKCAPRIFAPEKFALAFFCLPAEFCSAAFGSRCGIPWKDQTEEIKKSGKILLQWRKIWHTVYIRNEEDFRWTII